MKVTELRKCIGSVMNFRYKAIRYSYQNGKILENEEIFGCSESLTSIRRLEPHGNYEMFHEGKWTRITESMFASILGRWRMPKIIRRRNGEVIPPKDPEFDDVVIATDHFTERLRERFSRSPEAIESMKAYIFENGYVIPGNAMTYKRDEMEGNVAIFEKDLSILIIASPSTEGDGRLVAITTYSPGKNWFHWFLKDLVRNECKLDDYPTLKKYTKGLGHEQKVIS